MNDILDFALLDTVSDDDDDDLDDMIMNYVLRDGVNGLCILLRRLACPNRLGDLESVFGYSYAALSEIMNTAMEIINDNKGHLLQNLGSNRWLNEEKLRVYSEAIHIKGAPMNNLWAFIDGTVRPICRPTVNQRAYYSGHKRVHCVKYQSLLCPDGIIVSLKCAYPGARHDAGIFRESGLYEELEEITVFPNRRYVIYGDQGYGLRELLIRPFSQNEIAINPERQHFNNTMSVLRVSVEWGFSKIITEFAFLDLKKNLMLLLQEVGTMYSVATLLTNCHTCLHSSQQSTYFNIQPPTLEQYLGN
ncbi:hypothetical protein NQ315_014733 [Exocentrus adspersus]|uniref:DDE Tnp4 domain-containing protein n=1 Tax=Exocentrus adspersus TaxID=1586481 RepID=A0AAV8VE71_9CUCU|nr:hypothetical protein NQ315_014733 [Exocentrus adspersus]